MLLDADQLEARIARPDCLVVDCRFELSNPRRGRELWLKSHIPGARYADLDQDLSSPVRPDSGRHPLPSSDAFADFLGRIGWQAGRLLAAYDQANNALAVRLWWLMRFFGIEDVALLDGGFAAWQAAGKPVESGVPEFEPTPPPRLQGGHMPVLTTTEVESGLSRGEIMLLDARDPARFRGESEPLDSRAGHIPGAVNRPLGENLDASGRFLRPERLRDAFGAVLAGREPATVAHSCGSGVTACHNLFAMERAGLAGSALYAGSWSEWIRDENRPVATGA